MVMVVVGRRRRRRKGTTTTTAGTTTTVVRAADKEITTTAARAGAIATTEGREATAARAGATTTTDGDGPCLERWTRRRATPWWLLDMRHTLCLLAKSIGIGHWEVHCSFVRL